MKTSIYFAVNLIIIAYLLCINGCNSVIEPKIGETLTDVDGNVYHTVTIASQTWMTENLRCTHYNDNTPIQVVLDSASWENCNYGAICWYENDSTNYSGKFGALYNWYAVSRGLLAPKGWHVATSNDWLTLENNVSSYISSSKTLSKILASQTGWSQSLNQGTTGNNSSINNSSLFSALPAGVRINYYQSYSKKDSLGAWWTSTLSDTIRFAIGMSIGYNQTYVDRRAYSKWSGFSVRCVKDN
ncbi:MAG: fibrobacter succinogenes major paralogous domain-containing protein [Opitutaceae bacterium]